MKLKSFLIAAVLIVATISLSAQTNSRSGKFGVGIDDISTSPNFLFKYYLTDNF
jgi:hypothetical protein